MHERFYWLGFSVFPGIGPVKFQALLNHFGTAKTAWHASQKDLKEAVGPKLAEHFQTFLSNFSLEQYIKRIEEKDVWFATLEESTYPQLLKQIPNPPFVLYGKGNKGLLGFIEYSENSDNQTFRQSDTSDIQTHRNTESSEFSVTTIAVVGTRKITSYGKQITGLLTQDLVRAGCVIVSGLAMGVDAVAHMTAVENLGKTIAVLGCGVDCCFPATNQTVYDKILEGDGAIVSEYAISAQPTKGSFPSRNRIIAGLSQGVLVTEGAEDSGALITAQRALEFGRKVFAVPGPITSSVSKGPLILLQKGAKLVTRSEDILQEFGLINITEKPTKQQIKGDSEDEQQIIDLLQNEPLSFDELVKKTKIDASEMGTLLSLMEVKGIVEVDSAGIFSV